MTYPVPTLSETELTALRRVYGDLKVLCQSEVPAVRAAARAALAQVAQALNGQGLEYELYTKDWTQE